MDFDNAPEELESIKNVTPRNPHAAARGRAQFLAQAKKMHAVPAAPISRQNRWNLFARRRFASLATAMLLALGLLIGGASAAVVSAQTALPDDVLYPVKLFSEDARVNLAPDPATRAELLLDFANRRAEEVAASNAPNPAVTARAQTQLQAAMQIAAQLDDASLTRVLTKAEKQIERQAQHLEQAQAREMIEAQRALVQLGLQDKKEFRQRVNAGKDHASPKPAAGEKPTASPAVTTEHPNPIGTANPATAPAASNDSSSAASPGNSNASPAHGTPPAEPPGKSAERTPPGNSAGKGADKTPGPPPDVTHGPPAKSTPEQKNPPGQTRRPQ